MCRPCLIMSQRNLVTRQCLRSDSSALELDILLHFLVTSEPSIRTCPVCCSASSAAVDSSEVCT